MAGVLVFIALAVHSKCMLNMALQGRSQDSVNGGAQLGAVTRPYIR